MPDSPEVFVKYMGIYLKIETELQLGSSYAIIIRSTRG